MAPLRLLVALLVGACALQVEFWPNAGQYGPATITTVSDLADLSWPGKEGDVFSARVLGEFMPPYDGTTMWNISCSIDGISAYLYLDDHLVCQGGNDPATWSKYQAETSVPWPGTPSTTLLQKAYFLRASFVHSKAMADAPSFKMLYSAALGVAPRPVPPSAFRDALRAEQMIRLNMSDRLTHGRWNTWAKGSVTAHALLPHGLMLKVGLCQVSSKSCKEDGEKRDIDSGVVRLGSHALDHSYTQLYFAYQGANVSIETSQLGGEPGGDFVVLVTPVVPFNYSDFAVVLIALMTDENVPGASWLFPGAIAVDKTGPGSISAKPAGTGLETVTAWGAQTVTTAPLDVRQADFLAWQFASSGGPVAFGTGQARTTAEISSSVRQAAAAEQERYQKYDALAEAKEASQAAMMWNLQFSPNIPGTFAPVSRGWGQPWVIFDWDNIFGAYQLSLDAKELAYSQLAAVIKTKTAEGMVPNFWQPQSISYDRTEPVVGAKVLREMFKKYGDRWIVELLYGDLYDWLDWFWRKRREPPHGLICLGSDSNLPTTDTPNMQAARYESGLDNSPMYDGEFFNATSGHMMLYDVGMSSMVAMELEALAELALSAFDPPRTEDYSLLSSRRDELAGLIQTHLWDEESGIFVNRFSTVNDSSFYRRISPTSFYPMLAGIATEAQAKAMMGWLMSPEHFCISPEGNFEGNSEDCYWGLPSIQASDRAFPPLGYWRGYVWGPMIQLVYWALQTPKYDRVTEVTQGRKALAKQATAMLSKQWRLHRHVCENFSPHHNATDCTGDHFYHWGGLAGFVSLLEAGYYFAPPAVMSSEPVTFV